MEEGSIKVNGYSIIGDRLNQQDAFRFERLNSFLFAIVCDGMGGMQGGEIASNTTVEAMVDAFEKQEIMKEEEIPYWIQQQLDNADRIVNQLRDPKGNLLEAGTTAVVSVIFENHLYWGSVGDSRIYYIRKQKIIAVNRMHNYNLRIDEMLKNGELEPENEQTERARGEALISYVGIGGLPIIDTNMKAIQMEKGDILLLCSDGLYKSLDEQQILAIVEESGENMQIASKRLCDEAYRLATKKQDNTTVVAIMYS